jgi:hypothetical protein
MGDIAMDIISGQVKPEKCKVIACATVMEEMLPLIPPGMSYETMEGGLHVNPENLKKTLQQSIDLAEPSIEIILLGYGLCSMGVVGLMSENRTLIVPKADDCTAIFLGSTTEYVRQHSNVPGTIYMSKGWLEAGTPLFDTTDMVKRYGEARARSLLNLMFKSYTRLAFIDTGAGELEHYRERSKNTAHELNLRYEEIEGSNRIITKLLFGPWDDEFVIAFPGQTISFLDFKKS